MLTHTHTRSYIYTYEIYKRNGVDMSTWNRRANPPATDVKESRNYDGWRVKAHWRRVWMSRNRQRQQEKEKQWELEREATAETSKNSSNRKRRTLALIFILCAPLAGTVPFCSPSYTFRCVVRWKLPSRHVAELKIRLAYYYACSVSIGRTISV